MEEVRRIARNGRAMYVITYNGIEYRRYPAGKHPNYYYAKLQEGGKTITKALHRQIYEDNFGPIPAGYTIHHKDLNPLNNGVDNLQLVTIAEHMQIHGNLVKYNAEHERGPQSKETIAKRRDSVLHNLKTIPRICQQCGAEFYATNVHQRFCTEKCHHKWQYTSPDCLVPARCEVCGKEFLHNKYLKQRCCSPECANRLTINKRPSRRGVPQGTRIRPTSGGEE